MAEGTYEYECSRAELLGIAPPCYEVWEEQDRVRREQEQSQQMQELDAHEEHINESTGKIDEINNILSITQQRLNKFKRVCGSLTNLLKVRPAAEGEQSDQEQPKESNEATSNPTDISVNESVNEVKKTTTDLQQKMSGQLNKLDALLSKTENAQSSMEHQNKQIKSILK